MTAVFSSGRGSATHLQQRRQWLGTAAIPHATVTATASPPLTRINLKSVSLSLFTGSSPALMAATAWTQQRWRRASRRGQRRRHGPHEDDDEREGSGGFSSLAHALLLPSMALVHASPPPTATHDDAAAVIPANTVLSLLSSPSLRKHSLPFLPVSSFLSFFLWFTEAAEGWWLVVLGKIG
ncbi:uncharacterized protein LOC110265603 [Arachis ipaensis]|uniref:uncharacterized protein LOC110265603 n=1 Tax=Arachis ipaensis TaxID=130454 RepID=UPI000A2B2F87|nr:uncharacterized protein LOC110265603 [Arachis ipaensis]